MTAVHERQNLQAMRRINMGYVLRFVQRYRPDQRTNFMKVEAKFAAMEQRRSDLAKGRRLQPHTGREPSHTLIWEAEFPTLAEAEAAVAKLSADAEHEALFGEQAPYMTETYTEINEILKF
jgi:hypothetical protein